MNCALVRKKGRRYRAPPLSASADQKIPIATPPIIKYYPAMRKGFTLVELAIVLCILALLVGGVLVGQTLIRAAEIRSITSEHSRYAAAISAFQGKYLALPGDISNATAFWGKDNTNCASHSGTAATSGTCNGNGDKLIDPPAALSTTGEAFQAWKHMALAGLVEGDYTGLAGASSATHAVIGTNVPASKRAKTGWSLRNWGTSAGSVVTFAMTYANAMTWGEVYSTSDTYGPTITATEAFSTDEKMDDAKPTYGKVISTGIFVAGGGLQPCHIPVSGAAVNTNLDMRYNAALDATSCALIFRNAF